MVWNKSLPTSATKVKNADDAYRANFAALDDAIEREHAEVGGTDEGYELPSRCGVAAVDTYTNIDALSDVEGGFAFATDVWDFYINDGATWQRARQIPSGTVTFFYNNTAPTGWTVVTTLEDRMVILDDTAGGATGGSWTLSGIGSDHTHTYTTVIAHTHTHTAVGYGSTAISQIGYPMRNNATPTRNITVNSAGDSPATTTSVETTTLTYGVAWRPEGYACLVCSKD